VALDFLIWPLQPWEPESESYSASIEIEAHDRLLTLAESVGVQRLVRPPDFYEDAKWAPEEVPALLAALERLLPLAIADAELQAFLRKLRRLALRALELRLGLAASAD